MTVTYIHQYHTVDIPLETVKDLAEVQFKAETSKIYRSVSLDKMENNDHVYFFISINYKTQIEV